jgi:hypothetical protein
MKIFKLILASSLSVLLSCQKQESLQSYFVSHQESPGFVQLDLPVSTFLTDDLDLSDREKEAWNSVRRLNMLAFVVDDTLNSANTEYKTVEQILKSSEYEQLLQMKSEEFRSSVFSKGSEDKIDEMVLTLNQDGKRFLVARLLGNNMTLRKAGIIANSLDRVNFNATAMSQFEGFL